MNREGVPFWEAKSLDQLSAGEWESLCDRCGRCCLVKLEDQTTGEVHYTNVVCSFLDVERRRCTNYENREQVEPNCIVLTPEKAVAYTWLPKTCAYRLLALGKRLYWWHPLVSNDPNTVREAGIALPREVISERDLDPDDLPLHIVRWEVAP